MTKSKRLALGLALLMAFIMLFSVLFIVLKADHDCCGEGCAICTQIHFCEDFLRSLMTVAAFVAAVWCLYALTRVFAYAGCSSIHPHTLIVLKVKLSD